MNEPDYPTESELTTLKESSTLHGTNLSYTIINDTSISFTINIPIYGVIFIDVIY